MAQTWRGDPPDAELSQPELPRSPSASAARAPTDAPVRSVQLILGGSPHVGLVRSLSPAVESLTVYVRPPDDGRAESGAALPIRLTMTLYSRPEAIDRLDPPHRRFLGAVARIFGETPQFGTFAYPDAPDPWALDQPGVLSIRFLVAAIEGDGAVTATFGLASGKLGPSVSYETASGDAEVQVPCPGPAGLEMRRGSFRLPAGLCLGPELLTLLKDGVDQSVRVLAAGPPCRAACGS